MQTKVERQHDKEPPETGPYIFPSRAQSPCSSIVVLSRCSCCSYTTLQQNLSNMYNRSIYIRRRFEQTPRLLLPHWHMFFKFFNDSFFCSYIARREGKAVGKPSLASHGTHGWKARQIRLEGVPIGREWHPQSFDEQCSLLALLLIKYDLHVDELAKTSIITVLQRRVTV